GPVNITSAITITPTLGTTFSCRSLTFCSETTNRAALPRARHLFWPNQFIELFRSKIAQFQRSLPKAGVLDMRRVCYFGGFVVADLWCQRCYQHKGTAQV